jgi:preprotein translocase subunit SecA
VGDRLLPIIQATYTPGKGTATNASWCRSPMVAWASISVRIWNDAIKTEGKSIMGDVEKVATLALIDDAWKEHLRNVDDLKESVQGASFEQKDPLVIYKMEAYNLFEGLIGHINAT